MYTGVRYTFSFLWMHHFSSQSLGWWEPIQVFGTVTSDCGTVWSQVLYVNLIFRITHHNAPGSVSSTYTMLNSEKFYESMVPSSLVSILVVRLWLILLAAPLKKKTTNQQKNICILLYNLLRYRHVKTLPAGLFKCFSETYTIWESAA